MTRIDKNTNLVDISDVNDGVLAIKAFADVINHPDLGIRCFTCIALAVDYGSVYRRYPVNERPKAAMRFVTGSVETFHWDQDLIMEACYVYNELQFNEDMEEIRILQVMRVEKLTELKDAKDFETRKRILTEIKRIKEDQSRYSDSAFNKLLDDSESKSNGYKLRRLEQKQKNKNTFYYGRKAARTEKPIGPTGTTGEH